MPILADHKTNELLTEHEHKVLGGLLILLRDETQWVPWLLGNLSRYAEDLTHGVPLTPRSVIDEVISTYYHECTKPAWMSGVLVGTDQEGGYQEIDESEFKELSNYLKVLRAGGWLGERASFEFNSFAEGKRYTPGEVIEHLVNFALDGFQMKVESTKGMLRDYPQLFEEDIKALSAAVTETQAAAPVAEPEAATPQRKTRMRTSRKSAAPVGHAS